MTFLPISVRRSKRALALRQPLLCAVCLLALCLLSPHAAAQTVPDAVGLLGQDRANVQAAVGAQPMRANRRLPGGLVGLLQAPDVLCESLHFSQTLYFRDQALEQVEWVWLGPMALAGQPPDSVGAFAQLLGVLRSRYGTELASAASTRDTVMETASWVAGNANVQLYRAGRADHPVVRLVIRQRRLVDAGDL